MAQQTLEPAADAPRRRGRGASFWVGIALVVAGLGVLGYVAWQFFGTTYLSERRQQEIVEATREAWRDGSSASAGAVSLDGAEALVRIPRFGKQYVVPVQSGTTDEVLAEGYGHFEGTAEPGGKGNYALAAHRVTHGEPLRRMPELRPGDRVLVETRDATYVYRLDTDPNELVVTFNDVWVVDPLPTNPTGGVQPQQLPGQRLITLTTCAEIFHTDDRMIAFGHLVKRVPRQSLR